MNNALLCQLIALVVFLATVVFTLFKKEYILAAIPTVAALAYFGMIYDPLSKEKYRYVDWAFTTPLMLFAILSANRMPLSLIAAVIGADLVMIYFGYKGTLETTVEKKMFDFWISCAAFLPVLYILWKCKYTKHAKYLTLVVWVLYPVLWYMNETGVFDEKNSTCLYAVMDICAKVGLVYFLQE